MFLHNSFCNHFWLLIKQIRKKILQMVLLKSPSHFRKRGSKELPLKKISTQISFLKDKENTQNPGQREIETFQENEFISRDGKESWQRMSRILAFSSPGLRCANFTEYLWGSNGLKTGKLWVFVQLKFGCSIIKTKLFHLLLISFLATRLVIYLFVWMKRGKCCW